MRIFNKLSLFVILMLVLVAGCNKAETAEGVDTINAQGIQDIIAKNKGKAVLINFWATWCPPCRAEIPELIELRKKFSDDELVMISVSVDESSDLVDEFMLNEEKFNYPVYFAADDVGGAFRIQSIPRTMLFDPAGQRVFDKEGSYPGAMFERYINKMLKDR
ncbi:TlpA disulfide reductase family protein [Desulfovibrio sp. JC022]|uniref:TlpA family protein disulfide reductase n=1 Tax=Desulfovibrio sp. JC022 TaxID=2593642 RepID=UPI0013CF64F9|nr:TlpA disulfide reductase family protein [Desulfovibrio sp. JC022]NDV22136.1 TlpA family protein disulfide reductase [Desulfovibrio sp. JC022]